MKRQNPSCCSIRSLVILAGLAAGALLVLACLVVAMGAAYYHYANNEERITGRSLPALPALPPAISNFWPATPTLPATLTPIVLAEATSRPPTLTPYLPQTWTPTPSATPTPTPTVTPSPTPTQTLTPTPIPATATPADGLPYEASVGVLYGGEQSLPLSCESRSAVDWAGFFGVSIGELEFQQRLPASDNPNIGFVGDPNDERGRTPPHSYGVHSPPVAALLREYGLSASSRHGMDFQTIRREISAGRPVIVWVIGNVWAGAGARAYTASDGEVVIVAPYEHTVIVVAYTQEIVTVVDGHLRYTASIERFLDSWRVLGYQGIVLER